MPYTSNPGSEVDKQSLYQHLFQQVRAHLDRQTQAAGQGSRRPAYQTKQEAGPALAARPKSTSDQKFHEYLQQRQAYHAAKYPVLQHLQPQH